MKRSFWLHSHNRYPQSLSTSQSVKGLALLTRVSVKIALRQHQLSKHRFWLAGSTAANQSGAMFEKKHPLASIVTDKLVSNANQRSANRHHQTGFQHTYLPYDNSYTSSLTIVTIIKVINKNVAIYMYRYRRALRPAEKPQTTQHPQKPIEIVAI